MNLFDTAIVKFKEVIYKYTWFTPRTTYAAIRILLPGIRCLFYATFMLQYNKSCYQWWPNFLLCLIIKLQGWRHSGSQWNQKTVCSLLRGNAVIRFANNEMMPVRLKHHSSVALSAPTIVQPQVRIPSTPSMLFSICIIKIVIDISIRQGRK